MVFCAVCGFEDGSQMIIVNPHRRIRHNNGHLSDGKVAQRIKVLGACIWQIKHTQKIYPDK